MTMEEAGLKGFTDEAWYGLLAPGKVPPAVLERLGSAMKKVMADATLRERLDKIGARPVGNTPEEFKAQIHGEIAHMKQLVQERHIKLTD
jgi:tripartite-type tricarboxylate transporter receptor subunit TctC